MDATLAITNVGTAAAGSFSVAFFISNDAELDAFDNKLRTETVDALGIGNTTEVAFRCRSICESGEYVLALVTLFSGDHVNTPNNLAVAQVP